MIKTIVIATALVLVTASSFANAGQRFGGRGGSALDRPTFGEKFMMSLHKNRSVNAVRGAKPQSGSLPGDTKLNPIRNIRS